MKVGILVEGGGMRGIYASGIIDVLLENNIQADALMGVSAGAIHGCNFISRQKGRSIRYYEKYMSDPRFMSIQSLLKTGDIVGEDFCYHEIPEKLDLYDYDTFNQSSTKFYVVVANVETAQAEYIEIKDMKNEIDYMRASASLPFFSKIVEIDGHKYLDGGVIDSIPIRKMMEMDFDKIIVILTRERGYKKKSEYGKVPNLLYHKYPEFWEKLKNRHIIYNQTLDYIDELENQKKIFVFRPTQKLDVPRLTNDFNEVKEAYLIGIEDGNDKLPSLQKYLQL